jgi:hypothetical protein
MKKLVLLFVTVLFIVLLSCEKEPDSNSNEKKIAFVNTKLGGCHNEDYSELKSTSVSSLDTVVFTLLNEDTLNVFVGMNYICCAPFISETEIVNDTLIIEISDTCSSIDEECYCRCNCYYTWDFQFVNFEKKKYFFIVKLNDPREENTIIFKQGMIDLSTNLKD